jgi:hypothetical protein
MRHTRFGKQGADHRGVLDAYASAIVSDHLSQNEKYEIATTTHSPTIKTAKKFKAALAMCCFILRFLHRDVRAGEGQPDAPSHGVGAVAQS